MNKIYYGLAALMILAIIGTAAAVGNDSGETTTATPVYGCPGTGFVDYNGDGNCDNFVDTDNDGINDNCGSINGCGNGYRNSGCGGGGGCGGQRFNR
ncbi:MAG TPA: hypothetical protein C5S50_03655 [Methanosarcinaceae archaeon]|nr:hypothetical protein [Methanosarcinaceae archaeon]